MTGTTSRASGVHVPGTNEASAPSKQASKPTDSKPWDAPPPESPPKTPIRAPTPGRGPLNSHPNSPGPHEKEETAAMTSLNRDRADSFRTPTSQASAARSPHAQGRPGGVRRLLSLTNLRSSFSSSRTSLSLPPRESQDTANLTGGKRPMSPSIVSSTNGSPVQPQAQRRQKKSGNWFKRKSSMFGFGDLEAVDEDGRPDSKRLKETSPAPLLPEIGTLAGGNFSGGDMGWDETTFKR